MKYNCSFDFEVYHDSVYYTFKDLRKARKFVKNKNGYIIKKCWLQCGNVVSCEVIEISN